MSPSASARAALTPTPKRQTVNTVVASKPFSSHHITASLMILIANSALKALSRIAQKTNHKT